nr:hypothetical protein [Prolixibacteraceae bacterium]
MNRFLIIIVLAICLIGLSCSQAFAISFTSTASTPQKTDGTKGTITVVATGTGTVQYRLGLMGVWTTSGHFTNLTSANYTIYAKDEVIIKPISTSVFVDYIVHIPDASFKAALVGNAAINTNSDAEIQVAEAAAFAGEADVSGQGIADLSGIEWFTNITVLHCTNNALTDVDLSANLALTYFDCANNDLASLDISANNALTRVRCTGNSITDLMLNTVITQLFAEENLLTGLDVSLLPDLAKLDVSDNLLTSLDVSNNPNLTFLECPNNALTSLNVRNGQNTLITTFDATNNDLTCITVDDPGYSGTNWTNIDPGVVFSMNCPGPVIDDVTITPVAGCFGDSTGTISIDAYGGVGVLSYSIDNGVSWETTATFNNLPAGDYSVQVKDGNEVVTPWALNPASITQPDQLLIDDVATTIDDGSGNGSITVTASGGTPPYQYRLDDGAWQASNLFESLSVGTYMVYVRDDRECIDSTEASITEPLVSIPNAIFKAYLVGKTDINTNGDDEIQVSEAENFSGTIDVYNKGIDDLTGIEAFRNLDKLYCSANLLTTLDVSNNTALTYLYCSNNSLTSLDLTNNTALTVLSCSNNSLSTLDVTNNPALTNVYCANNSLTSLKVTNNPLIFLLECSGNLLPSLDVSGIPGLKQFYCNTNLLSSIDVSSNPLLYSFACAYNSLTSLDLSNNSALQYFSFSDNASLSEVNVQNGHNPSIITFNAKNNPMLSCITVDDPDYSRANWTNIDPGVVFSLNCADPCPRIENVEADPVTGCAGDSTGTITVSASGGVGALSYSVDNGATWQASGGFTGLPAGEYVILIKDEN